MHIKFLDTGTGSARAAMNYLLKEKDHKQKIRAVVKILRGNPELVTQLAETLTFKHIYRSAVIAWHKDDNPTTKQIDQVLDDFEKVAFAGFESNQYAYYAVLHQDENGAKHIHIIAPRVELKTGKSMNIAPPGWEKTYSILVDKYNVLYGWASPKDIARKRTLSTDKMHLHTKIANAEAKKIIHKEINKLVLSGEIKNRADIKAYLAQIGEITRESKDYISVKPKGFKKAIRLKGAYYEREFSIERISKEVRREERREYNREREYERICKELQSIIEKRARYNRERFNNTAIKKSRKKQKNKIRNEKQANELEEVISVSSMHTKGENQNGIFGAFSKTINTFSIKRVKRVKKTSEPKKKRVDRGGLSR